MLTEDQGTRAIIELQALIGFEESEETARGNWRKFNDMEKRVTEIFHQVNCGGFEGRE